MYGNNASKTVETCNHQSPVVISNNAIVELGVPATPDWSREGFIIVDLEESKMLCQELPEKELFLK